MARCLENILHFPKSIHAEAILPICTEPDLKTAAVVTNRKRVVAESVSVVVSVVVAIVVAIIITVSIRVIRVWVLAEGEVQLYRLTWAETQFGIADEKFAAVLLT